MGLLQQLGGFLVLGGIGAAMALVGVGSLQNARRTRDVDPVDVRTLEEASGTVALEGTARVHEETARAPFTDTESLLLDWDIEEDHPPGPNSSGGWFTLESDVENNAFLLDDGTGSALVDPAGANVLVSVTNYTSDIENPAAEYFEVVDPDNAAITYRSPTVTYRYFHKFADLNKRRFVDGDESDDITATPDFLRPFGASFHPLSYRVEGHTDVRTMWVIQRESLSPPNSITALQKELIKIHLMTGGEDVQNDVSVIYRGQGTENEAKPHEGLW